MALYSVAMLNVSLAAAQDLWHLKAGATRPIIIHSVELNQKTLLTVDHREIRMKRHTVTVTQGSGGTTPTPTPLAPGSAASGITAHMNDTVQASAGTLVDLYNSVWNFLNGFLWVPAPEDRPVIDPATGFIVALNTAPGSAIVSSGAIVYEEIGA